MSDQQQQQTPSIPSETASDQIALSTSDQPPIGSARSTSTVHPTTPAHSILPPMSVSRNSKIAGSQRRTFSTTSYAHRNLWQRGQSIIFGSASPATVGWQQPNVRNKRAEAIGLRGNSAFSTVTDPSTGISSRMGGRILETGSFSMSSPSAERNNGPKAECSKKPEQEDTIMRIRQLSKDANDYHSQLQAEMDKLKWERKKRPTADLHDALNMLVEISARAESVFKAAGKTSALLARRLAKQVEQLESSKNPTAPVTPEAWVTEKKVMDETALGFAEDVASEEASLTTEPEVAHVPFSTYTMPERILKIKQALPDSNVNKLWSHTYYTNPEGKGVDVHYCKTIEDCERVIPLFMDDKVVGFDMEWVFPERSATSIRQNVALIQIANESNIALIHVAQMGFNNWGKPLDPDMAIEDVLNLISPTLWKLIESPHIAKVGVNVLGDHRRLRNFLGVRPQGVFELSDLHNLVHATENGISKIPKRLVSLAKQTQLNLGLPLDKGLVRSSDWSRPMTPAQLKYAASDAYVGIRIFDALEVRRQALVPRPPRPALRDIDGPDDLFGAAAEAAEAAGKITATTSTTTTTTITTTGTNATASAEDSGQSSEEAAQSTATLTDEFSAQINMAGEWMTTYTSKFTDGPGPSLSKPQIRAYALWHHGVLDIGDIARIWRDPPLKESTVATYVLEAVMIGRLPCDVQRLKSAHGLISAQLKDRYRGLLARLA